MRIYDNGIYRDMTEEELKEHEAFKREYEETVAPPTQFDKLEAQVTYTALMTDTLLTQED